MTFSRAIIAAAIGALSTIANAVEIIHYQNRPVTIELVAGEERTIQFGDHVAVGTTSGQMASQRFRIQSAQGALHILPVEPFAKERIQVKRLSDGRILLFDISARSPVPDQAPLEEVRVFMPDEDVVADNALTARKDSNGHSVSLKDISPVELTRYAAQRFYGPQRLHQSVTGITTQPVGDLEDRRVRVFKGGSGIGTTVKAIASFQGGSHHLAALMVLNESDRSVTLDYLDINVPFSHATLQHHRLAPMGQPGDRTMLYLINNRPAREFLVPWDAFSVSATERGEW